MAQFYSFELKEFDAANLTGSFQNLGTSLSNPARYVHINNGSDVDVYITNDGSNNLFRVPAGQPLPMPASRDKRDEGAFIFSSQDQLQIKQTTGTGTGFIAVHIFS